MSVTRIIERAFSLLPVVTLVLCAVFAAKFVNHFVEARYMGEAEQVIPRRVATTASATVVARSKEGGELTQRNMFCSDCETSMHEPAIAVASAGAGVPDTQLPLRLVTTNISTDPKGSFVSLVNTSSGHKGAYWMGHSIPGAGPIEKISGRYVDFHNRENGRLERVRLELKTATVARPKATASARPKTAANSIEAQLAEKVRQVNDSTWEVDRSVIQLLMSNPKALRGARVGPAIKDGKIVGFRVSRLSSRSPVSKIGVRRGDVIRAANGVELNSPDVVLGLMTKVQTLNRIAVTVERGGKNIELTYLLR